MKEVKINNGIFAATGGWGKDGEYTTIECDASEITSVIYSDSPQYN